MDKQSSQRVFLSYVHEDLPWVAKFRESLKAEGVESWSDEDNLTAGKEFGEEIGAALRESRTLVLILSPRSLDSAWVHFELGAALADRKQIIPVLTESVERAELPGLLKHLQVLRETSPCAAGKRVAEQIEGARRHS